MKRLFNLLLFSIFCSLSQAQILQKASISLPPDFDQVQVESAIHAQFPISNFRESGLSLAYIKETPGGQYWHFLQTYRNIPIYQASVKVKINRDNRIHFFMNNLKKAALAASVEHDHFSLTDIGIQIRLLKQMPTFSHHPEAVWFPNNGTLRAAYLVNSYAHQGTESYELILDAATGEELQRTDIRAYHHHQMMADTSGRGRVFRPNPCTAAGVAYGTLFSNNDGMHLPIFENYMDTVELKGLQYSNGKFLLNGPYVRVMEFSVPNVATATSTDGNFFFDREQTGFEDVMAYYHIDTFQRYVQFLGYTDLYASTPIEVDAHGAGGADNSSFSTNGRIIYGTNYAASNEHVDDAEDADVIIHEYGHALSFAASPNTRGGAQRVGLDEGYGDYFAAAYSYDIRSDYGWDQLFNWDGHNEFWPGRSAKSDLKYATSGLNRYEYGQIWATAMMRLRQDIGATDCDKLQMEVLYGGANGMEFPDAYQLLLQADTALFGGIYFGQITHRFCEVEVVKGLICSTVDIEDDLAPSLWAASYDQQLGISVCWLKNHQESGKACEIRLVSILGQEISRKSFPKGQELHFYSLAKGLYVLSLWEDGQWKNSHKVVVW
jgi:hypothetical protein